jgi:hypothetical protein
VRGVLCSSRARTEQSQLSLSSAALAELRAKSQQDADTHTRDLKAATDALIAELETAKVRGARARARGSPQSPA